VACVIVVDANVVIAYLDSNDVHHPAALALFERESAEQLRISPLTLAEALVAPARAGRLSDVTDALEVLMLQQQAFRPESAAHLAELRARTGLKMPDCCVLLAAVEANARLASLDDAVVATATSLGIETVAVRQ
jgi:predicted nucleic acid-binding protein